MLLFLCVQNHRKDRRKLAQTCICALVGLGFKLGNRRDTNFDVGGVDEHSRPSGKKIQF